MVLLVKFLGIVAVVLGVVYIIKPEIMRQYIDFWTKGKRLHAGAVLSLLIGIVFLLAASQCSISWFIALFGILGIVKGIVLFAVKQEKAISWCKWWMERPVTFLRIHALLVIAIGVLLIYAA